MPAKASETSQQISNIAKVKQYKAGEDRYVKFEDTVYWKLRNERL